MDVLVLSDTHGARHAIERMLGQINFKPSAVLFLGDGLRDLDFAEYEKTAKADVFAVAGNCDVWRVGVDDAPEVRIEMIGGKRIVMMHGHTFGVKGGPGAAIRYAHSVDADVLLFGHTHVPMEQTLPAGERVGDIVLTKPLLVANPGSLGQGMERTFGVLTVQGDGVLFSHGRLV